MNIPTRKEMEMLAFERGLHYTKDAENLQFIVNRCLFLSIEAKQLYNNLSQYMKGDKKGGSPSQAQVMLELNLTPGMLRQYLDELRTQGMIETVSTTTGVVNFTVAEVVFPMCLKHSELIWRAISSAQASSIPYESIVNDVNEYRQSDVCNKIMYGKEFCSDIC